MIAYGIGILPLIKNLKREISGVTRPWYADDTRVLGTFSRIETYFNLLTFQGLVHGYYPKPSKSVLIVHPENIKAEKYFSARHGFKVCTGARYLGKCIRDDESKSNWLRERTLTWEKKISTISETAGKYPQESYFAVVRAIQSECIFLQRITWYTGDVFAVVDNIF